MWIIRDLRDLETQRGNKQKADEYAKKLNEAVEARVKQDD